MSQTQSNAPRAPHGVLQIYEDADQLAGEAARRFAAIATETVERFGQMSVALSGGGTPKAMFVKLAQEPYRSLVPWKSTHVFWADERCVPPSHPDSNYRLAMELLLSRVPIPATNIYRIPAEVPYHDSARQYSEIVRTAFSGFDRREDDDSNNLPRFDLILLGLGDDGHTASLFPHSDALKSGAVIAVANYVEKLKVHRITLTPAVISSARNVIFLIAGESKARALRNTFRCDYQPEAYPAQLITPTNGTLIWMADTEAASLLSVGESTDKEPGSDHMDNRHG